MMVLVSLLFWLGFSVYSRVMINRFAKRSRLCKMCGRVHFLLTRGMLIFMMLVLVLVFICIWMVVFMLAFIVSPWLLSMAMTMSRVGRRMLLLRWRLQMRLITPLRNPGILVASIMLTSMPWLT